MPLKHFGLLTLCLLFTVSSTIASPRLPVRGDVPSGVLYDLVLPLSGIERFDGSPTAPPASFSGFRQAVNEIQRATVGSDRALAAPETINEARRIARKSGVIPLGVFLTTYDRLPADALVSGVASIEADELVVTGPLQSQRALVFAPLARTTYRGDKVRFHLSKEWMLDDAKGIEFVTVDFDDGNGPRRVNMGETVAISYAQTGSKKLSLSLYDGRQLRHAAATFDVRAFAAPAPDDTLSVTATIPYNGGLRTGEAYVLLSPEHTALTRPVVVLEGLDLDNTTNWDELYDLLNGQNLIEDLRAAGYDAVVFNFTDATLAIQGNAFATIELLNQIQTHVGPQTRITGVGASMGGLVMRYALAYMETNAIPHQVETFISFDAPHGGANIPLGIQYWLDFFESESAEAAYLLSRLDRPAARQMLVYHHTTPPSTSAIPNQARLTWAGDLAAVGDWPHQPRLVSVANGSGTMANQGFNAGAQIVRWDYNSFLVDITGDVWSVPDGGSQMVTDCEIDQIWPLPDTDLRVTVNNPAPFDNAPGGSRNSMQQMDEVPAPYGDIVALHNDHCFIPTISALALNTADLFYDIDGDPNLLAISPFDEVYFPAANEPHVELTPGNAAFLRGVIFASPTSIGDRPRVRSSLAQNYPNPFNPATTIAFDLAVSGEVRLDVFNVRGALVRTLLDEQRAAGAHRVSWNGTDNRGRPVASGAYFYRLATPNGELTRRMMLLK